MLVELLNDDIIYSPTAILEQPGPGPVLVPVGKAAELTCSVSKGNGIQWEIHFSGSSGEVSTDSPGVLEGLEQHQITVQGLGNTTSVLTICSETANNGTRFRCVAVNLTNALDRADGTEVEVLFFGRSCSNKGNHTYTMIAPGC